MSLRVKKIILIVLAVLLLAEIGLVVRLKNREREVPGETQAAGETEAAVPGKTDGADEAAGAADPSAGTHEEQSYILTFVGDCTFGSISENWYNSSHFIQTVRSNYGYPFDNVRQYFAYDDFTILNLEGPLTDDRLGAVNKRFAFRGPTDYTQIMTGSSVEAVSLANNHTEDYGAKGYESTKEALTKAGIAYVEKNSTAIYTTESGLVIGIYAASFDFDLRGMKDDIAELRENGAEIVICSFHWGEEGKYKPTGGQQRTAKAAIDAGADVVYGHHPHVLQKIETYKGKYIFYSLGNFSFGGAALPGDYDTALLQLQVVRDSEGKVNLGELGILPCSISSEEGRNNFQPTALKENEDIQRVLSKLTGKFEGKDLEVDYSKLDS